MSKISKPSDDSLADDVTQAGPDSQKRSTREIADEVRRKYGDRMDEINQTLNKQLSRITGGEESASKEAISLSLELADTYFEILNIDVEYSYRENIETQLFRQAFYRLINALRTAAGLKRAASGAFAKWLQQFLSQGLAFYKRLIGSYEKEYKLSISKSLFWKGGLPADDLRAAHDGIFPGQEYTAKQKRILRSLSRHFLALGNLNRYVAGGEENDSYSRAKACYLRAVQFWPETGHAYNQLAILSVANKRLLDEMFFSMRALSCLHPFEATDERMNQRLSEVLLKIEEHEEAMNKQLGRIKSEAEIAFQKDRSVEIWVRDDGHGDRKDEDDESAENLLQLVRNLPTATLSERFVQYALAVATMLLQKLSLENFLSVSTRMLVHLIVALEQPGSPLTALQLSQVTAIFIYVLVNCESKCAETITVPHQLSVQFIITYLGVLLQPLSGCNVPQIVKWLSENEEAPRPVRVPMPSVFLLAQFFSNPIGRRILGSSNTLEPLSPMPFLDAWSNLANAANLFQDRKIRRILYPSDSGKIAVYMPELFLVASFCDVFPHPPKITEVAGRQGDGTDLIALHARLASVAQLAHIFVELGTSSLDYDTSNKEFFIPTPAAEIEEAGPGLILERRRSSESKSTREQLTSYEQKLRNTFIVVKPTQIVPDTNAFVDHLQWIEKIINSGRYTLLIPTVVIQELSGLSLAVKEVTSRTQALYVNAQAKKAVRWIEGLYKTRPKNVGLLTKQGVRIQLMSTTEEKQPSETYQINDDLIVESCALFAEDLFMPPFNAEKLRDQIPKGAHIESRGVVLLTDDRGMHIKASIPGWSVERNGNFGLCR
ncbi:unnamed protein product, partial [Mesorhabditis spiculigera]